jgi:hypothetical protein
LPAEDEDEEEEEEEEEIDEYEQAIERYAELIREIPQDNVGAIVEIVEKVFNQGYENINNNNDDIICAVITSASVIVIASILRMCFL